MSVENYIATGIARELGERHDRGSVIVTEWISVYVYMDESGERRIGWDCNDELSAWQALGMIAHLEKRISAQHYEPATTIVLGDDDDDDVEDW